MILQSVVICQPQDVTREPVPAIDWIAAHIGPYSYWTSLALQPIRGGLPNIWSMTPRLHAQKSFTFLRTYVRDHMPEFTRMLSAVDKTVGTGARMAL
ncbi:hypothetical protein CH291_18935 [Rhodococcus sp. 14-1411-2a]|nr:hypothetical protein CH291_18935 [Rhodococcus sp. 14-1411-2a]